MDGPAVGRHSPSAEWITKCEHRGEPPPVLGGDAQYVHAPMTALLRHTGRRSGRSYATVVGAWLNGEMIVGSLTFGNQIDWVRNVVAAGCCSIRLDGRDYEATHPEFLDRDQAKALYMPVSSRMERASFRLLGIRQFMCLHAMPVAPDRLGPQSETGSAHRSRVIAVRDHSHEELVLDAVPWRVFG